LPHKIEILINIKFKNKFSKKNNFFNVCNE